MTRFNERQAKHSRNQDDSRFLRAPAYHRQRLLLFLVEAAGGALGKMDLQKLLFLYLQETGACDYAFVPYRFGCYSFQANDDLDLLCKRGWLLEDGQTWVLTAALAKHAWALQSEKRREARRWIGGIPLRGKALVREVYRRYPYYAIRSEIREDVLSEKELARVEEAIPRPKAKQTLFTIGYEGIQFEDYANKLLQNGVQVLSDVRRNPLSRKFGFSKRTLSSILPRLGIDYTHIPELGIASGSRQNLDAEGAREQLFDEYARTLPKQARALEQVVALVDKHGAIALTCFECKPEQCHRHCISDYFAEVRGVRVRHL